MKIIFTKRGEKIIVSSLYYLFLNRWNWSVNSQGYAVRFTEIGGVKKGIRMHRQILDLKDYKNGDLEVDHINRNKLDNRISNLRIVSRSVNQRNRDKYFHNKNNQII